MSHTVPRGTEWNPVRDGDSMLGFETQWYGIGRLLLDLGVPQEAVPFLILPTWVLVVGTLWGGAIWLAERRHNE